jgi:hypothetical protein
MKRIGILPAIGLFGIVLIALNAARKIDRLEKRVNVLETQYGVVINGWEYQTFRMRTNVSGL